MYISHLGFMELEDFVKLIHNNKLDQYIRDFRTNKHLCSPKEIMNKKQRCFYCLDCFRYAESQVKECEPPMTKVTGFQSSRFTRLS